MKPCLAVPMILLSAPLGGLAGEPVPALPPSPALHCIAPDTPEGLRLVFSPVSGPMGFVDAHRGGPREGFPENCLETFEDTLRHAHAIMEVDPRYTGDGAIVLHHDASLERTTDGKGRVADLSLKEVKALRLKDPRGVLTTFAVPTLDEALEWARGKTILVLDRKDVPLEARVRKIAEHRAESYALVIVYSFKEALACHALNPDVMMEVMIPDRTRMEEFDATGIPWNRVVAFVGHTPPKDPDLCAMIRAKGACTLAGTSRTTDRKLLEGVVPRIDAVAAEYRSLLSLGVALIETDIPRELGALLHTDTPIHPSRRDFFRFEPVR